MRQLSLIISVVFYSCGFAQQGNMIVDEDRIWSTLETHCLPGGNNYSTNHIKFEGDTVIDGFGVGVGDTVVAKNIYLNSGTLHFIVTSIGYVGLLDGLMHKQVSLFEYNNLKEETWVEGLGSYYGILNSCNNPYGGACGSYKALCYQTNGDLVYQDPEYSTCHYEALVEIKDSFENNFSVYPNPAKSFVCIDFEENTAIKFLLL